LTITYIHSKSSESIASLVMQDRLKRAAISTDP